MKKTLILFSLLFLSTIVQAQSRIDSIQLVGVTADSLEFVVHSSMNIEVIECYVEYKEGLDNIKVNVLYSAGWNLPACYCPYQKTINIKKAIYQKAIVSLMIRYPIGGTEENPEYSDEYWLKDSKEIDLSNITSIGNVPILPKIEIFPNPVKNVFYIKLQDNRVTKIEIFDIQGISHLSKEILSDEKIDVTFLSQGIYFVLINKEQVFKIIKE